MAHREFRDSFLEISRSPVGLSEAKGDTSTLITSTMFTLSQLEVLENSDSTKRQIKSARRYVDHMLNLNGLSYLSHDELKENLTSLAKELALENPKYRPLQKFI